MGEWGLLSTSPTKMQTGPALCQPRLFAFVNAEYRLKASQLPVLFQIQRRNFRRSGANGDNQIGTLKRGILPGQVVGLRHESVF